MNRWYVVNTLPRAEDRALWHLRNQGFECFLPRLRRSISHARKTRVVMEPLFPRYLFTCFDAAATRWRAINGSRGVVNVLTDGPLPAPVPQGVVETLLRDADAEGVAGIVSLQRLWQGRKVRIVDGAFAGHVAEVDMIAKGSLRVSLLLSLLGRVATLHMPVHAVEPV